MTPFQTEWARCLPWIEAALADGGHTHSVDDVLTQIGLGEAQFWPGAACAVVTEFCVYPKLKALHCWLAGGDMDELINRMVPEIEVWGHTQDCTRFTLEGRRGWQRILADHGYQAQRVVCVKDVT